MARFLSMAFILALVAAPALAGEGTYGEAPRLTEETSIVDILARPQDFDGKTVQVKGPIKEVCQEAGCWFRVAGADGSLLLAKSSGDRITIPTDSVGRDAVVEGVVIVVYDEDEQASSEEAEAGHTCASATIRLETRSVTLL